MFDKAAGIRNCGPKAYSAELQPTERLWPLTNEGAANQGFTDLEVFTSVPQRRCEMLH